MHLDGLCNEFVSVKFFVANLSLLFVPDVVFFIYAYRVTIGLSRDSINYMKTQTPYSKHHLDPVAIDALKYDIIHGDKRDSFHFNAAHVKFDTRDSCQVIVRCAKLLTNMSIKRINIERNVEEEYYCVKFLSSEIAHACYRFSTYRMHPHIELFLRFCTDNPLYDSLHSPDVYPVGKRDELITELKCQLQDKRHLRKLYGFYHKAEENYTSLMTYCNKVLLAFKTIWVIRLDISLIDNCTSIEDFDVLEKCRISLLKNRRRNEMFKDNIGHIWRLKHSPVRGYYYHLVLMFDGAAMHESQLISFGKKIERYWRQAITKNTGECKNYYLPQKGDFNSCFVGVRHADREEDHIEMEAMVSYLTKRDKIIRLIVPKMNDSTTTGGNTFRLLGMGKVGKPKKEKDYRWQWVQV